jgi:hypothetical protein
MAEKKVVRLIPDLLDSRVMLAEGLRNIYQATVDPSVQREDLLNPKMWKHVARKFQPYTRIEVVTDDGQYYCELLVTSCGNNWASVKELSYTDLRQSEIVAESSVMNEYVVLWKGPVLKFAVIRKSDGESIKSGMGSKEEANRYFDEYIRTISR